ncbi:unnamed protein product [Urochloa decumbens]|uniref:Protein EARLY HEADING DATE 2 n=1 Tax=Urochloa decumbens TaxID=240449 RepID=A0ABC9ECI8_9POAL
MASNSSAAAVAALFGIRDGDHQDQIKPLLAQQQLPPAPLLNAAASSAAGSGQAAAAASPPVKKKRNLPDPDAEVIALSPKTLMATNRFVCEVCNKGFQREQNLQLHRRGHNLPWKLKQKDPLQAQRRRVYLCPEPTCAHHDPARALGDLTGIKKHFCRKHGEKKWKCDKCSKRYAVQSDWKAHSKVCGTREYRCDCGTLFSRRDSFITHRAFCDALAQESARLPPTGHLHGLYGGGGNTNMALSLSQVGSHLASTLAGDHHQDLLRLAGGGHLLVGPSSSASAFRPPPLFLQQQAAAHHHEFQQGGLMHLPDLQGNGAAGGLFNPPGPGYSAAANSSSGTSTSHGHQLTISDQQFSSEGGGGSDQSSAAAMLFGGGGGGFAAGDHHHQVQVGLGHGAAGVYNNVDHHQQQMLPQMSATALLHKASQMGSSSSGGGASVFAVGSSAPPSAVLDQSHMHLQTLMNSLAGGGMGMFAGAGTTMMYDMVDHHQDVKFSQQQQGPEMTRDFLGVGVVRAGMPVATSGGDHHHHHAAGDMSAAALEAEIKSSSFTGGGSRMQ